jgi:hypothetical protein
MLAYDDAKLLQCPHLFVLGIQIVQKHVGCEQRNRNHNGKHADIEQSERPKMASTKESETS